MNKRRIISLIIWWCEGTKPRRDKRWRNAYLYPIEVTNCDPRIIKSFVDFLREEMGVANVKLHGQIQIHKGDNQWEIENYWSKVTGIPRKQFNKTIIRDAGKKPGKNRGTFKVRTYGRNLFKKLETLLEVELKTANIGV